ncbi:hypothetical protein GC105_16345 [Alkalibaculum sp. M08DMB]|uniref:CopG family transcriptional regulator n=1 Tax=Alkalibaculum sporogenes TaxID=2655001 RepID=A0A6A7KDV5_9FIRM|nr:hypothetical protein [Alkalibaculum sporogenes]MPW27337.1 hypothetical protein [Alkalibaculum sporogenes]
MGDKKIIVPKGHTKPSITTTIRLKPEIMSKIEEYAKVTNRPKSQIINMCLIYSIDKIEIADPQIVNEIVVSNPLCEGFSIRIKEDIIKKLDIISKKAYISKNQIINICLEYSLNDINIKENKFNK